LSLLASIAQKVENNQLPHALLFEGGNTLDRKAAAMEVAHALHCGAADLLLIEGGTAANSLHIEEIRALRDSLSLLPNAGDVRIGILLNTQSMTVQAQNALLKVLEEPPNYAYLIMTAPSKSALLDTILSRVSCYSLGVAVEEEADQARQAMLLTLADNLFRAFQTESPFAALEATAPLEKDRDSLRGVLPILLEKLRKATVQKASQGDLSGANRLAAQIRSLQSIAQALTRNASQAITCARLASVVNIKSTAKS
jgi:DNA polymerase-3 subunit delta'